MQIIDNYKDNILRLKGYIKFEDDMKFVEVVGDKFIEKSAPEGHDTTSFVVIAWNIRENALKEAINQVL
jgi:hypothetical protein